MTEHPSYAARAAYDGSISVDRESAVTALFTAHHTRLVIVAQMLVDDVGTAEDVVQDAFAALYRRWPYLRDKGAAIGYVQASVVNGARSHLRRRRGLRFEPVDDAADPATPAADEQVLRDEAQRALAAGLAALPLRQRQVVVLRYYLDQSEAEIASTLSISRGSVKKHASRALTALALRLEGQR
jgi:RNA polymerase sigma-70 factor (sigma-E family)